MKFLLLVSLIVSLFQSNLRPRVPDQMVITTTRYNFTAGRTERATYRLTCSSNVCVASDSGRKIKGLYDSLIHPYQDARAGLGRIVTQSWLDSNAELAYQHMLQSSGLKEQENLHSAFIKLYRDRSNVLKLLAKAYNPVPPNIDEYYQVTGKAKDLEFETQRSLLPFLLPIKVFFKGHRTESYDPMLSKNLASVLKSDDSVRRLLNGDAWADFVASLVWLQSRPR